MRSGALAPGFHRVVAPLGDRVNCVYVVVGSTAVLLYDIGTSPVPGEVLLPYLEQVGVARDLVRWLVVSHGDVDHFGGARDARRNFPGLTVCCGVGDEHLLADVEHVLRDRYDEFAAEGLPEDPHVLAACRVMAHDTHPDLTLSGQESIHLGPDLALDVVALPGHSRGCLGLWHAASGTLLAGDAVLGRAVPDAQGRPALPPTYRHAQDYLDTVERIRTLAPQLLLTAHYPVMGAASALAFLTECEEFADELDAALLAELGGRPDAGLAELAHVLAPRLGHAGREVPFAQPLAGHLERLLEGGRVRRSTGVAPHRWSAVL